MTTQIISADQLPLDATARTMQQHTETTRYRCGHYTIRQFSELDTRPRIRQYQLDALCEECCKDRVRF